MTDFSLYGHNLFGEPNGQKKDGILAAKYEFPPFSVLDARQGEWQERKRMWIGQGIKGEIGREDSLLSFSDTLIGKGIQGTSIFDPVLCEIMYRWFCPGGGRSWTRSPGEAFAGLSPGFLDTNTGGVI